MYNRERERVRERMCERERAIVVEGRYQKINNIDLIISTGIGPL